jgi:hypothetical protein
MRFQRLAIIGAICWTVLVGYWFSFGSASVVVTISGSDGREQHALATQRAAQLAIEGGSPFLALVYPVILAAVPLFAQSSRRVLLLVGTMLLGFSILGAASGGVFHVPAALLLLLAAIPSRDHTRAT